VKYAFKKEHRTQFRLTSMCRVLKVHLSSYYAWLHEPLWRRKTNGSVIIHSDQGTQFGSYEFSRWCKGNRLSPSMSRSGNCWDNAVAESFFSNLKIKRIKKRIYSTRSEAKSEIFDYIEGFYNRVLRHKHLDQISPLEFERRQTAP
jgi:putative transposase